MTHNTSPGRPPKYPWRTMEIGQSFLVIGRTSGSIQHDAAKYYRPRRYKCRTVTKNGMTGVRVERIM